MCSIWKLRELLTGIYVSITVLGFVFPASIPGSLHASKKILENSHEFHDHHKISLEIIAMYWLDIVFHLIG